MTWTPIPPNSDETHVPEVEAPVHLGFPGYVAPGSKPAEQPDWKPLPDHLQPGHDSFGQPLVIVPPAPVPVPVPAVAPAPAAVPVPAPTVPGGG